MKKIEKALFTEGSEASKPGDIKRIPIHNIRQLADEEWNALAYRNYLERKNKGVISA